MDLMKAQSLARHLMDENGLTDWKFEWSNARSKRGYCQYVTKTIRLSRPLTAQRSENDVTRTIKHEIAHALLPARRSDGSTIGHGREWKAIMRDRFGIIDTRAVVEDEDERVPLAAERDEFAGERRMAMEDGPLPASILAQLKPSEHAGVNQYGHPTLSRYDEVEFRRNSSVQERGYIIKVGRSRYHVVTKEGTAWTVPFRGVKLIKKWSYGDPIPQITWNPQPLDRLMPPPPALGSPTGQHAYLIKAPMPLVYGRGLGDMNGQECTIIKSGPKNHHVKVDKVNGLIVVPKQYVVRKDS